MYRRTGTMPEQGLETLPKIDEKVLERIGTVLKGQFNETETKRQNLRETEWLESLRQYKGIYDPDVLAKIKNKVGSEVYPRYTRSKVQPTIAKLNDMLFPNNDKNWEIKHTPDPELTPKQIKDIVDSFPTEDPKGNQIQVTDQDIEDAINAFAKDRAERMAIEMNDQLLDLKYVQKGKSVIRSGVMYGTGIVKGPLSKSRVKRKVVKKKGEFAQEEEREFKPYVGDVSLWTWFPDMTSTELENCEFVYELHSMTKHETRNLGKKKHFKKDVINEYLRDHKKGDYKMRQWEIDLKTIKGEENVQASTNKYEVLEYNGYLDGHDLMSIGVLTEEEDPNKDWFVNIFLLGDRVIKAIVHPVESLTDLYHVFYYEKDDSSIFGEGLPRIIRDTAISICSSVRAMLDNAAWVAGPITEVNEDLLSEDEESDDIYPGRQLSREGRGMDAQFPALRIHNINSHMTEYLSIIDKFESIGDMESTTPAQLFAQDAKTTNETSKGVSIRASTSNLTTNDIVKNFDDANESLLKAIYKWNMEFNPDEDIKGDMEIKAIGASSLVSKEARTQALEFFSQGLQPEDKPYIKRRPLLKKRMVQLDLDAEETLYTEEEAQANIQRATDSEVAELQKRLLEAETRYENAKALNMETKSEKTMKEIPANELDSLISALKELKELKNGQEPVSPTA
jgi:hypothetical protein